MSRTCVIVNPRSGSAVDVADMTPGIRAHPFMNDAVVRITGETEAEGARALAAEAVADGFQRILACGGDGTLNEVVNGVGAYRQGVVVGVLPLGTGNDFARTIGFPADLEAALALLPSAAPRALDLVRVSGGVERLFINVAAGGFSGQVDEELTPEMKAAWGPLAYLRSALAVLPDLQGYCTTLSFDGEAPSRVEALNVVVANGRTAAGGIPVAPEARLDDGLLDVVLVEMAALKELARLAPRMLAATHLDHELVRFRRARSVAIESHPGMWFNVDGELVGKEPLTFEALPAAITFLTHPNTVPGLGLGPG